MKKYLLLMLAIVPLLFACSSSNDEPAMPKESYYRITYKGGLDFPVVITAHEIDKNQDECKTNKFYPRVGEGKMFTASSNATQMVIEIGITSPVEMQVGWIKNIYYLFDGQTIDIVIDQNTEIAKTFK